TRRRQTNSTGLPQADAGTEQSHQQEQPPAAFELLKPRWFVRRSLAGRNAGVSRALPLYSPSVVCRRIVATGRRTEATMCCRWGLRFSCFSNARRVASSPRRVALGPPLFRMENLSVSGRSSSRRRFLALP